MPPLVSVVLPVYNGEPYLAEAIESILNQNYKEFECIIINDGSKDGSQAIVKRYSDPRIRYYEQSNQGLAATLNRGISLSKGTYIARQDQDDISLPYRLSEQVHFLEAHQECALVGSWAQIYLDSTPTKRYLRHPSEPCLTSFQLLFDNALVHSSVLIRKSSLKKVGNYTTDPHRQPPEDFELWSRIVRSYQIANIPHVLLNYREIKTSMSRISARPFAQKAQQISAENLAWAAQRSIEDPAIRQVAQLSQGCNPHQFQAPEVLQLLKDCAKNLATTPSETLLLRKAVRRKYRQLKAAYHYLNPSLPRRILTKALTRRTR